VDTDRVLSEWRRLSVAGVNNRAAAAALGLSEAALLATGCGSLATRLDADPEEFLGAVRSLGPAKYVVRNDYAVLERAGEIEAVRRDGLLEATGSTFTLRLDASRTGSAFALEEPCSGGMKRSLQLFDRAGATLVKVVFKDPGIEAPFQELVAALSSDSQAAPEPEGLETVPDAQRAAPPDRPARNDTLAAFLRRASELSHPVRFCVRNTGASIEATAPIQRIKRSSRAPWINVLDPGLDLHLYEARITGLRGEQDADTDSTNRWLHWLADDGTLALSTSVAEPFAAWVLSANGLRERAVQA
jgi:putative hemin transport protein